MFVQELITWQHTLKDQLLNTMKMTLEVKKRNNVPDFHTISKSQDTFNNLTQPYEFEILKALFENWKRKNSNNLNEFSFYSVVLVVQKSEIKVFL